MQAIIAFRWPQKSKSSLCSIKFTIFWRSLNQIQMGRQQNNLIRPEDQDEPFLNPEFLSQQQPEKEKTAWKSQTFRYILVGIFTSIFVAWSSVFVGSIGIYNFSSSLQIAQDDVSDTRLPKIFWFYTRGELQAEKVESLVYFYHQKQMALHNDFEVRVVNSWTAYDWLSQSISNSITKTIQNAKIDETVDNLLKLALLMEHGGVMSTELAAVFLDENLAWMEKMFTNNSYLNRSQSRQKQYKCSPQTAEVFIANFHPIQSQRNEEQLLLAAIPQSKLIRQAFQLLSSLITSGHVAEEHEFDFIKHCPTSNIAYLHSSFQRAISLVLFRHSQKERKQGKSLCEEYGLQDTYERVHLTLNTFSTRQKRHIFQKVQHFHSRSKIMLHVLSEDVTNMIQKYIHNYSKTYDLHKDSLLYKILQAPGNREIFFYDFPERRFTELCLIVIDQLGNDQVPSAANLYRKETYNNWTLILFAKNLTEVKQPNSTRVQVLQSKFNPVRNIEWATTKVCSAGGYALLLRFGQQFSRSESLSMIAQTMQRERGIVGASINLEINGKLIQARPQYLSFSRSRQGTKHPDIKLMEGILNHMRIFAIDSFRYIPQFQLRDIYGRYFSDRLIFLMTLLQLVNNPGHSHQHIYIYKKYAGVWNMPVKAVLLDSSIFIRTASYEKLDVGQLQKTKARYDAEELSMAIYRSIELGIPMSKFMVFNRGDDFIPADKKQGPDLIPKVIHQAWIGSQMPTSKKYFLEKTTKIYPSYQIKLWREENITRENFPRSYDLIMNLLDFHNNRHSAFSKLATITDLMRHQILYNEGGFWRDSGMNILKPVFDRFLKYRLAVGAQRTFRHRWNMGMCFFANAPRSEHLLRVTNYRNLNRMRIYYRDALAIAGPIDFRQIVTGNEEQDPDVLLMHYEYFYSGELGRQPFGDLCTKPKGEVVAGEAYQFQEKGCVLLANCEQKYPEAYGLDHNCFGVSWRNRRF